MKHSTKIVLTAERTLMSNYHGRLFLGFCACAPRGLWPDFVFFRVIAPPVETLSDGRAKVAPYGSRKIEAALLEYGFSEDDVAVVPPSKLKKFVGRSTKVVGVTTNDPLGLGPATSTFSGPGGLVNKQSYNAWQFEKLMERLRRMKRGAKIVVGGAGAWQLLKEEARRRLGIDVVVVGEGEKVVPPLFEKIVNGEDVPEVVYGEIVEAEEMPTIRGATVGGIVEIARGCGRGCKFCIPTLRKLRCRPLSRIVEEVEVNARYGVRGITLHAEDVLRYGAKGVRPNEKAVVRLFEEVLKVSGVEMVGPSHFALSSVACAPRLLEDISALLGVGTEERPWVSGQTGIETGSPRLMEKHMYGKALPFSPSEWPDVVEQAFGICSDNHWVPCATLIMGLPGEVEDDVLRTIELLDRIKKYKGLVVPLFFVALGALEGERSFTIYDMRDVHWELMLACWRYDIKWIKELAKEYLAKSPFYVRMPLMRFVNWLVNKVDKRIEEMVERKKEEVRRRILAKAVLRTS